MRPTPLDADDTVSFQPPPPPPPCHDLRACTWRPYSNSRDFEANAAVVVIILLCGLICSLALNTAIRCFLRRRGDADENPSDTRQEELRDETKPTLVDKLKMAPALVFSAEIKPKLAGAEAECTICLTEFSEGEEIRVLAICKHGFHVQCIQTWLILHSSCPTCRCSYLPPSPSSAAHGGDGDGDGDP
ncbi:RING-H2 finger protein ATL79, partial [Cucurbita argyrosperma subsp. argyrosperma]